MMEARLDSIGVLAVRLLEVLIDHQSNVAQSCGPRDRVPSSCVSYVFLGSPGGGGADSHRLATQRNQVNPTAGAQGKASPARYA